MTIIMACSNQCERLYSPTIVDRSYYTDGKKYCRRCEIYLHYEGAFCLCCGMALRVTPSNKRDKEKLRLKKHLQRDGVYVLLCCSLESIFCNSSSNISAVSLWPSSLKSSIASMSHGISLAVSSLVIS